MSKSKLIYTCNTCGAQSAQWSGYCPQCQSWNSISEEIAVKTSMRQGYATANGSEVTLINEVPLQEQPRFLTNLAELDRVLGGGLVHGSVILIGGDPGIGKSTLLLQTLCQLSLEHKALYVTGEESLQQVSLRARRLGLPQDSLYLLAETNCERIIAAAQQKNPQMMVIDSIQTIYTEQLPSAPGSVGQVRESAAQLVRYAKQTGTILFLVGHVTKEGTLAGPRVLEHMVDTVLYFEGDSDSRYRLIRAVKNRFGAVNELGIFGMTDKGLRQINNPSGIFLSRGEIPVAGSTVMVTWEGSRPMLVEIQALVDDSYLANPRRVTVGLEQNRLAMLLAVLHRHGNIATYNKDIFINVVGGVRINETSVDLALLLAISSSLRNKPLPHNLVVFGEVGLAGEIRPIQNGQERLREAVKHGFKQAIVPKMNAPKQTIDGLQIHAVQQLREIFAVLD